MQPNPEPTTPKTPQRMSGYRPPGLPTVDEPSNIKVICRVRPLNIKESAENDLLVAELVDESTLSIRSRDINHFFAYDRVFDSTANQQDIYDYSIEDTVKDVLSGYNGTILAYGQTGSGKSYTMLGPSISDDTHKGLIPRISDELFSQIKTNGSPDIEYTVSISIMEIYLEKINDLLVESNRNLSVHEDKENGIYVKGLSHGFISNTHELYKFLKLGIKNRTSTNTNMNLDSSRSHAIFQIRLTQNNLKDESVKKSNLFLIDLAGSEKVDKTGVVGNSLKEAKNINSSLSALGNVIYALTDNKSTHIPYRDSKLTRILQESLGGNSRTTLIITVSPSSSNEAETLSTLRFGSRAKAIKNKARINKEISTHELKFRLKQLEKENDRNKAYIRSLESQLKGNLPARSPAKFSVPTTPMKDFESKIPTLSRSSSSSPSPPPMHDLADKLAAKEAKIKELEEKIISYQVDTLKILNEDEVKLDKLETALYSLSQKLSDVENININLRKHLMISEKVIEQRDQSIRNLNKLLSEQQHSLNNQSMHFENRLSILKSRINDQKILNLSESPRSPLSPKMGLNLKIIKPIIGGNNDDSEDEDDDSENTFVDQREEI